MRSKSFIWILVVLLVPTMACGIFDGDDDDITPSSSQVSLGADAPTVEAAPVVEATQVTENAAEPDEQEAAQSDTSGSEKTAFSGTSNLDQFSSYRVSFKMEFDGTSGNQPAKGIIEMLLESTKAPKATHLDMSMEGSTVKDMGGSNSFEFYDVNDTIYMYNDVQGGQWISMPSTDDSTFNQGFFAPDENLELPDTANCASSPEMINGISATPCTFNEEDVQSDKATYQSLTGHVWVAEDGDFIVKYELEAEGYQSLTQEEGGLFDFGSVSFVYELLEVDTDFTITPPEEALNAENLDFGNLEMSQDAGDMPVLDNAEEVIALGGIVTYYTASDIPTVIDFYRQELPALGWAENQDSSFVDEKTALLAFENADGKTLTLTISADESGRVNVGIIPSQ